MMDFQEAEKYLFSRINYEHIAGVDYYSGIKLERMYELLRLLGNPHKALRYIHIAGTKGKGSVSAMLAYILASNNSRVGLYTSPHLYDFRERIRLLSVDAFDKSYAAGEDDALFEGMISKDDFARLISLVSDKIKMLNSQQLGSVTFFETLTAVAFLFFKERQADYIILETGLGGRLDATNVVEPLVSVITSISRDHTKLLGDTLTEIAFEKAGIIKPGIPAVLQPQLQEARSVLKDACMQNESPVAEVGIDMVFEEGEVCPDYQTFSCRGVLGYYEQFRLNLLGRHQIVNAATALAVIDILRHFGLSIYSESIAEGFLRTRWPLRCEVASRSPLVMLDGAHNAHSMSVLLETITRHFRGRYKKLQVILGFSKDKDIKGIAEVLAEYNTDIILTRADHPRAASVNDISMFLMEKNRTVDITASVEEAVDFALKRSEGHTLNLVAGSLFVAAQARKYLLARMRENARELKVPAAG